MAEFFAMGGYGAYVWPAYGLAAIIFVGLLVLTRRGLKAEEQRLETLEKEMKDKRARS